MKLTKLNKVLGTLILLGVMGVLPAVGVMVHSVNGSKSATVLAANDGTDPMPPFPRSGPGLS